MHDEWDQLRVAGRDSDSPDPDTVRTAVLRRAALLAPSSMLTSPVGALFVVLAVMGDASWVRIGLWCGVFVVTFSFHYGMSVHTARRVAGSPTALPGVMNSVSRLADGVGWGLAGPILAPSSADVELRLKVVLVLAVVGVSGGIVIAGGARYVAQFICSLALPLVVLFALDGGALTALLVPGLVTTCALTVWYGWIWNRAVFDATVAQMRSAILAERLESQVRISEEVAERSRELHIAMSDMARRDDLTGMLNRRGFFQGFQHVDELARTWHVALLDVDHFKHVNDNFGHAAGDEALRHIARTMLDAVPDHAVLGRLGGEEFALVLPDVTADEMVIVVEQIRSRLDRSPTPGGHALTVSVGIAAGGRGEAWGLTIDQALSRADAAMYRAKASGRDAVVLDEVRS